MISKVKKIKNLWVFNDFKWEQKDFLTYNLFYWWNGSWKTTLSNLFYGLQNNTDILAEYGTYEFTFTLDDGTEINQDNFKTIPLPINVFNEEFIKENIDFSWLLKSILLISKENIEETTELQELIKSNSELNKKIKSEKDSLEASKLKIESELSKKAKEIKVSFQTIDTKDTYYLNYDKTKLKTFLSQKESDCKNESNILNDEELSKLVSIIKPNDKWLIELSIKKYELTYFIEIQNKIKKLLETNITEWIIDRLKNNSDISDWIEKWLEIHEKHSSWKCEFCWSDINSKRIEELKKHFSDEVKELRDKLNTARQYIIDNLIISKIEFDKNYFYLDLQSNFSEKLSEINKDNDLINIVFNNWLIYIDNKIKNPTLTKSDIIEFTDKYLDSYNKSKSEIDAIIEQHNKRFNEFDIELKKNQSRLELHHATEFQKEFNYFGLLKSNTEKEVENNSLEQVFSDNLKKESDLKWKLSNETLWADEFNKKLAKFIWHKELSLKFDKNKWWYEIIRAYNWERATKLSEWEKTAIAFIYFIIKLQEKWDLTNEIVCIDDPISSFDSNNIFSAYSFIKSELENNINQLFIYTHNYSFFRLIRDWFIWKNWKKKPDWSLKPDKSRFYQIDIVSFFPKVSTINDACDSIINYNSEYHFVFSKLNQYKNETKLDLEKSFQVANLSRKLLESFLSFKFPKKRNDFKVLLNYAIKIIDITFLPETDKQIFEEKIFKFINKYSHLQVISFWDDSENNQLWESDNIINEVFNLINWIDENHYKELVEVCS